MKWSMEYRAELVCVSHVKVQRGQPISSVLQYASVVSLPLQVLSCVFLSCIPE